ncbi:ent-kaurene oxidase [Paraphoma chrysanthemicola]|nr:ent-kaurene oxidase [Paraphoma chrysanthemicola]
MDASSNAAPTANHQIVARLWTSLPTAICAALIFALITYVPTLKFKLLLSQLPNLAGPEDREKHRQKFLSSARLLYKEGYDKVIRADNCRTMFSASRDLSYRQVQTPLTYLILLIDAKIMEVKYTKAHLGGGILNQLATVVKADLTPALGRLNPPLSDKVNITIRDSMPPCTEWTEVDINATLLNIVAIVSGSVFVGTNICRDPAYLDCTCNYALDLGNATRAVRQIRPWLRPLLAPRLPEVKHSIERQRQAVRILTPEVQRRIEAQKNDPDWHAPDDMLQWFINRLKKSSVEELADLVLITIFAALHTTTMTTTSILHTIAATPQYHEELRQEIRTVTAEHDGIMTMKALQQMQKLDSYMKEVTRFWPSSAITFQRVVTKDFTLSNGQRIPKGANIEVPSLAVHMDDAYWPNAADFDPFRHYRARNAGEGSSHAANQFVSTTDTSLNFGYGSHACPGRFFAANEIKMIFARLLLEYNIKMPDGRTERYDQLHHGQENFPDPSKKLLFKKVEA